MVHLGHIFTHRSYTWLMKHETTSIFLDTQGLRLRWDSSEAWFVSIEGLQCTGPDNWLQWTRWWKKTPTKSDQVRYACAPIDDVEPSHIESWIIYIPNTDQPFTIETDNCNRYVGHVLLQSQRDWKDLRARSCLSWTLSDDECQYGSTQREVLEMACIVLLIRLYVDEIRSTVRRDPSGLKMNLWTQKTSWTIGEIEATISGIWSRSATLLKKENMIAGDLSRVP